MTAQPNQSRKILETIGYSLVLAIFCALLFYYTYRNPPKPELKVYEGLYSSDFRHYDSFEPCEVEESWHLVGNIRRITIESEAISLERFEKMYVQVEARLSAPGNYGHMDGFEYELEVSRVLKTLDRELAPDCGTPRIL